MWTSPCCDPTAETYGTPDILGTKLELLDTTPKRHIQKENGKIYTTCQSANSQVLTCHTWAFTISHPRSCTTKHLKFSMAYDNIQRRDANQMSPMCKSQALLRGPHQPRHHLSHSSGHMSNNTIRVIHEHPHHQTTAMKTKFVTDALYSLQSEGATNIEYIYAIPPRG